ncbi:kinase-like domain-containing protein [Rhizophagus irregularis DAOM 181602=DAOM 197198]|nr:kinase-like domain-containing protein [Rhizophagus irregularis DAOM 181602=DAOM 197198]
MDKGNETQVPIETEFINLNISDKDSSSVNISDKNCSYCNKPFIEELWCKECDPRHMFEGGFAKVYSATWIDGKAEYDYDWKRKEPQPIKVALKRLNGSKNMSAEYLNELKINWDYCKTNNITLKFYGMTKDPETEELMMILEFADRGTMRSVLSHNFNNILWKDKILYLLWIAYGLNDIKKDDYQEKEKFGYKGKEIKAMFEEADKEIPNISTLYEINPDAIYTSRVFTFSNLTKPVNSSIITSYLDEENNEDCKDSKLFDLEVSSSLQLKVIM